MDVEEVVARLGRRTEGVVQQRQVLASGCTRHAVRRALAEQRVLAVQPGVLAVPPLPERGRWLVDGLAVDARYLLDVRAAVLSAGPRVLPRGRSALVVAGVGLLVEPTDVELVAPHGGRRATRQGVDVRTARSVPARVLLRRGRAAPLPVVEPFAAVRQVAVERQLVEAVVALDGVLRSRLLPPDALERAVREGALGDRLGRLVASRCDPRAGSVLESVARLLLVQSGLGGFRTQLRVRAGLPLRVDFAWERERLVVEVDGDRYHQDRQRDQDRDNLCAASGFRVMRFGWAEVVHQPQHVAALVREALGR